MRKALLLFVLAVSGLWAQEAQSQEKPKEVVRVYQVKPGNIERIRSALSQIGIGMISAQGDVLLVRANPDLAPAVDAVVTKLNTTPEVSRNVELTFYIVQASHEPIPEAAPILADLQSTVTQLKSVFAYQSFRVLDTALMRSRSGEQAAVSGDLGLLKGGTTNYSLRLSPTVLSDPKPPIIRLDRLEFYVNLPAMGPGAQGFTNIRINGNVDFKEGQKAVIGKTGLPNQSALILVATGKVVE